MHIIAFIKSTLVEAMGIVNLKKKKKLTRNASFNPVHYIHRLRYKMSYMSE